MSCLDGRGDVAGPCTEIQHGRDAANDLKAEKYRYGGVGVRKEKPDMLPSGGHLFKLSAQCQGLSNQAVIAHRFAPDILQDLVTAAMNSSGVE